MTKRVDRSVSSEASVDPTPAPARPALSGHVLLPDGAPAEGALVALAAEEGAYDIAARTDKNGYFRLPAPGAGGATIVASAGSLRASVQGQSFDQPLVLQLKESSDA